MAMAEVKEGTQLHTISLNHGYGKYSSGKYSVQTMEDKLVNKLNFPFSMLVFYLLLQGLLQIYFLQKALQLNQARMVPSMKVL